jgi:hypothetical protein
MLFLAILLALVATILAMTLGLLSMATGGDVDRKVSTPLMWIRIIAQAVAVLLLLLALYLQ